MIEFSHVSFSYQGNEKIKSLDDITLSINDGECILLCGKSGCGKTTMTRLLNGIIPNFYEGLISGTVSLNGSNPLTMAMYEIARRVGSVFQNPKTQFYTVNTSSEIAFGCENFGLDSKEIMSRVKKAAKDLQIEYLLDRSIFQLSGGEKQIIAFASVYAMDPYIYVLDEPSSNLDVFSIEKIKNILAFLKSKGKTIIIAEHRTYYLKDIVDRAILMDAGHIIKECSMKDLADFTYEQQMETGIRTVNLAEYPLKSQTAGITSASTISLHNIQFAYKKEKVLDIPEMTLESGHITAIIGSNGAGKSTFVSCLCGLFKHIKGTFKHDDLKISARNRIKKSYLVMQDVNHQLFSDSVRDEICLGSKKFSDERLASIMSELDIDSLSERHPMTLSGGQKQRVIIASAMLCGKKILFFDEPTSGLDFSHMLQVCKLIKNLQTPDTFLFIITHDYEFIVTICDRIIHMEDGKLVDYYDVNASTLPKLKAFFQVGS